MSSGQIHSTSDAKNESTWKQQIDSLMTIQENAWNDGKLTEYMSAYHNTDSLIFVGRHGLTYGWQQTLHNYQQSYPDKEAMGHLEFKNEEYKKLGASNALVVGQWTLLRAKDTLSGSYSLNWQLIDGSWKIIADHSS